MNVKETIKSIESLNNRIKIASENAIDLIKELPNDNLSINDKLELRKHLNLSKEAMSNAQSDAIEAEILIDASIQEMREAESRLAEALKLLK